MMHFLRKADNFSAERNQGYWRLGRFVFERLLRRFIDGRNGGFIRQKGAKNEGRGFRCRSLSCVRTILPTEVGVQLLSTEVVVPRLQIRATPDGRGACIQHQADGTNNMPVSERPIE